MRGLNRHQFVKIARLTGCKNFVGKRKKFIFKRSSFIIVLHAETVQPSLHDFASAHSAAVGVVFSAFYNSICVFHEDAGCLSAWAAPASCSSSMHVPTDKWFSLSSV